MHNTLRVCRGQAPARFVLKSFKVKQPQKADLGKSLAGDDLPTHNLRCLSATYTTAG